MRFQNRQEAGKALAQKLMNLRGRDDAVVLAIPRGGVVVGYEIAKELGLPMDIYITRKIGAPYNPELALGAVASDGSLVLDDGMVERLGIPSAYLNQEIAKQRHEIDRRLQEYLGDEEPLDLEGKTVSLADDGIATGSTTLAAIRSLKKKPIAKLILAIPVGPPDTAEALRKEVDELVILSTPEHFWAVGAFYLVFDQTSDETVKSLLQAARAEVSDH